MKANAYSADCPTRQILDRVGDKWAVLILLLLRHEAMRFNQLRRDIEGISQKMLSQVLKSLERDGLVKRHAIATVPVRWSIRSRRSARRLRPRSIPCGIGPSGI
jgi:DNA-binding HxlR family transcriptional regulator